MGRTKILVIEDEPDILELVEYNLRREGYEVRTASDGEAGLQQARRDVPHLILLDLMLPNIDGLEVCRKLREDSATRAIPIVMVSARGEESDVVLGLELGAEDYVTKPFSPRVLIARVRAVLRRSTRTAEQERAQRIERGPLRIDATKHQATIGEDEIELTATEFRLLFFLASHPGRVFTRDHLVSRVVGDMAIVTPRNIDVHVRSIRKKLGDHRELIETVRGVGYRFREDEA